MILTVPSYFFISIQARPKLLDWKPTHFMQNIHKYVKLDLSHFSNCEKSQNEPCPKLISQNQL